MKISKIQYILSFLLPLTLKKVQDSGQKTIKLQLYKGQFQLSYGLVYYSDGKNYFPFRKAFKYIGDDLQTKENVLVLGAGIGSIGMILADIYPSNKWNIKYVDINASILSLCEEVMGYLPNINTKFVKEDAVLFTQNDIDKYELICVDVFDEHIVPKQILTTSFFTNITRRLADDGICILNAMFLSSHQRMGFEASMKKCMKLKKVFETRKNIIYVYVKL